MLGFIIGTVCLIGLAKTLCHCRGSCGRGLYGHRRWGGFSEFFDTDRRGPSGPHVMLRTLFERLATTPGQEKVIVAAAREFDGERSALREELKRTRSALAHAVASGVVDESALEETFSSHDRLLARLRVSFVEALKKVTEALDERQRKQLADILEGGGWSRNWPSWAHPYDAVQI
jgi:hypothetical protein